MTLGFLHGKKMRALLAVLVTFWAVSACSEPVKPEELANPLKYLSAAINATLRYDDNPAIKTMTAEELLAYAIKDDPDKMVPFKKDSRIQVKLQRVGEKFAVTLVCYENRALYEDAVCTNVVERNLVEEPAQPCAFTLDVEKICAPK